MSGARARASAAAVLGRLLKGDGSLATQLDKGASGPDAALVQEICYGVCRQFFALQSVVDQRLDRPLRNKDSDIYALLLAGAYQVFCMRIPDHAAVNESVQATRILKKPWAGSLVNGVLRKLIANKADWMSLADTAVEQVRWLHPAWLIQQLQQDWPQRWPTILEANNQRPPMTLRVNTRQTGRDEYLDLLSQAGIGARQGRLADTALYLEEPCPVQQLPGFSQGMVSVQDEASQLVPALLGLEAGMNVLDACAAPGGKTCHCLESEPSLSGLTALDISASRAESIAANLQRLGLQARIAVADASRPDHWWDGTPFQRILLDAPCSATGVIRRHPDIKILRRHEDLGDLAQRQWHLLNALWPCLAENGLLLYTTCSVTKLENESVISRFLQARQDAKHQAFVADWGVECRYGRQLFPEAGGNDGFYFALLRKTRQVDE